MTDLQVNGGAHNRLAWLWLGLAIGAMAGMLLQQRRVGSRSMPLLDAWQNALGQSRGELGAAIFASRVHARYSELYGCRPHFSNSALRMHLETGILPCLALYQVLLQDYGATEAALEELDRLFTFWAEHSSKRNLMQRLAHLPNFFSWLRLGNRLELALHFPSAGAGWRIQWVEDSDQRVAYNITECFYLKVLTAYGAPELTSHICRIDDLQYGNLHGVRWERTKTLGRGDDCCNFCFSRINPT